MKLVKMILIVAGIFTTAVSFAQETPDPNVPVLPEQAQPATPAVVTKAAPPAPIQLANTEDLVRKKTKMYSYTVSNVLGVTADENGNFTGNKNWRVEGDILNYSNGIMQVETKRFKDDGDKAIFTSSTKDGRATAAIFEKGELYSYTVVNNGTHYTATDAFCEIMRLQSGSKNFGEMAKNAATCEVFYNREKLTPKQLEAIPSIFDADRRALVEMRNSVAKKMVPNKMSDTDQFMAKIGRTKAGQLFGMNSTDPLKPRNILSKASTTEEKSDRMIMTELANACAQLWPEGYKTDDELASKPAPKPQKSGAVKK